MNSTVRGVFIGGEWRQRESTLEDRNPARPAELVGIFCQATGEDVADACATARETFDQWRLSSGIERGNMLHRAADLIQERSERLASDLTREEGKTIGEARAEVARSAAVFRYFAGETGQPQGEVYPSGVSDRLLYTVESPLGVTGLITPWNFPLAIPAWKIAPALAFGNTVVLKPSELTPACAVNLVEILDEAGFPAGTVNLVVGRRDPVGQTLVDAPELAGISFTGSLTVGRTIQREVVDRGVKVQLEMGGKNPVIVLPDADVPLAVRETVKGSMMSTGQKCTATSRAIVVGDASERFVEPLAEAISNLQLGDPLLAETDIGPLVSPKQLETVRSYLDVAREEGQELRVGAREPEVGDGYYVSPTLYTDVEAGSRIAREEIFGPVLCVIRADSLEEALGIANQVQYGLSASIFTRDIGRALAFVRRVDAGIVHVNSETAGSEPQVPFGGMKASSSHSREQGKAARDFYTDTKTVYIDMPDEQSSRAGGG